MDELEALYASKEQSSITESNKEDRYRCAHNDIVSYIYKNGIPKISVETFDSSEMNKAITKITSEWRDDVKKIVHFDTSNNMNIEYDNGTVMKCRCKLCGELFIIDRRLINKS